MKFDLILLSTLVLALLVLAIMCLFFCLRCRRRNQNANSTNPNTYTVPVNNSSSTVVQLGNAPSSNSARNFGHNRISSVGDRFAVPIDLLPPSFNYNAPGVEHKGNYVLIKDLNLIQVQQVPSKDEYQKQSPYNPNFA